MKSFYSILISLFLIYGTTISQCDTVVNKVMMVGDSWSNFPYGFGSFPTNLDRFGFTNIGMYSNTSDLSVNGAVTSDFLTPAGNTAIQNGFNANPDIEWVNLSIGGNDILDSWNNSMDSISTDSLLDATMARIDSIIQNIKAMKPGVKIYISGYDFANFGEVIMTYAVPSLHFFYSRWDGMGKPNFIELNTLLTRISVKFESLANANHHVFYNNALGLMQYIYGQTSPLGVAPSGTYAPGTVPFPGGRLDYPTPKIRMNDYVVLKDCFHLDSEGFEVFYQYHFEQFYWNEFRNKKDITLSSEGNIKDGSVTSTSIISAANVALGNSTSTGISKGIVSFNTSTVPTSSIIHSANLFLYRDKLTGPLPSFNQVIIEVKKGNFGTSSTLDFGDYNSLADAKDTACVYGTVKEDGYWLRISLPTRIKNEINNLGSTQYRITMIDSTNGSTLFFSTGDSTNQPFLDLEYYNPASVAERINKNIVNIYPNPTNDNFIQVSNLIDFDGSVTGIDVSGRQFPLSFSNSQIDISSLSKGTYFIIFQDNENNFVKRLVKL